MISSKKLRPFEVSILHGLIIVIHSEVRQKNSSEDFITFPNPSFKNQYNFISKSQNPANITRSMSETNLSLTIIATV